MKTFDEFLLERAGGPASPKGRRDKFKQQQQNASNKHQKRVDTEMLAKMRQSMRKAPGIPKRKEAPQQPEKKPSTRKGKPPMPHLAMKKPSTFMGGFRKEMGYKRAPHAKRSALKAAAGKQTAKALKATPGKVMGALGSALSREGKPSQHSVASGSDGAKSAVVSKYQA